MPRGMHLPVALLLAQYLQVRRQRIDKQLQQSKKDDEKNIARKIEARRHVWFVPSVRDEVINQ